MSGTHYSNSLLNITISDYFKKHVKINREILSHERSGFFLWNSCPQYCKKKNFCFQWIVIFWCEAHTWLDQRNRLMITQLPELHVPSTSFSVLMIYYHICPTAPFRHHLNLKMSQTAIFDVHLITSSVFTKVIKNQKAFEVIWIRPGIL